jgi:hypothetical protein
MDPVHKMYIYITISVVLIVFTVFKVNRSSLEKSSKILLYVMAFFMPIIALILFFILNRKRTNPA